MHGELARKTLRTQSVQSTHLIFTPSPLSWASLPVQTACLAEGSERQVQQRFGTLQIAMRNRPRSASVYPHALLVLLLLLLARTSLDSVNIPRIPPSTARQGVELNQLSLKVCKLVMHRRAVEMGAWLGLP